MAGIGFILCSSFLNVHLTVALWLFHLFISLILKAKLSVNKLLEILPQTAKMIFVTSSNSTPFLIPHLKKKQEIPFPTAIKRCLCGNTIVCKIWSLAKSFLPCYIETKSLKSLLDRLINCFKENLLCLRRWMS